jgi:hypothetical protein
LQNAVRDQIHIAVRGRSLLGVPVDS